jgi:23S rRNA (cytosine1962-C5)-methyltransferase
MNSNKIFDYELIDCGDEIRTERFGNRLIIRPCPMASWPSIIRENLDNQPDARFDNNETEKGWQKDNDMADSWNISVGSLTAELRFSPNGQVGIFPEQNDNWQWIKDQTAKRSNKSLQILNLFGYTGMATLHAIAAHTQVCHVDGAKSAISWAKRNAELSDLADANVRWICDDVIKFMEREIRRGQKYDAIILDPPAFGRGGGQIWKIEKDLPRLMWAVKKLLVDDPSFVVLTCHAPRHFSANDMAQLLEQLPQFKGKKAEAIQLKIPSKQGNSLVASFGARIMG